MTATVREHSPAKVPVLIVGGCREGEARTGSIRQLGSEASTTMGLEGAVAGGGGDGPVAGVGGDEVREAAE